MENLISYKENNTFMNLIPEEHRAFTKFSNETCTDSNKNSISLKTCIIENCEFNKIILSNSDFDGCKISDSAFYSSPLNNSDLCSSFFINCKFENINFGYATVTDSSFINCIFNNCNLDHISLTNCKFIGGKFEKIRIRQSSSYLNEFEKVCFSNSFIKGNFFYNLLKKCSYKNSSFDKKLFANNYGFGQHIEVFNMNKDELTQYQNELISRYDFFNAAIIELNLISEEYSGKTVLNCFEAIDLMIANRIVIRVEQIIFLNKIYVELLSGKLIAPITNIEFIQKIEKMIINAENEQIYTNILEKLETFKNYCYQQYQKYIVFIHSKIANNEYSKKQIYVKFKFNTEPSVPVSSLINQIKDRLAIDGEYSKRTSTSSGSFIDELMMPENLLTCIDIIVTIFGITTSIIIHKKENPKCKDKNCKTIQDDEINKTINDISGDIINVSDSSVISIYNNVYITENKINCIIPIIQNNNININNNYCGYNNQNIIDINCFYNQ